MKAILIIDDMPQNCEDCLLEQCDLDWFEHELKWRCPLAYKRYTTANRKMKRRDDCPLKSLPTKKNGQDLRRYDTDMHYEIGWNECLDAIEGEQKGKRGK